MSGYQFQILSDLHLETPAARPSYDDIQIEPRAPYLALLGDIGWVLDSRLFSFLERQLQQFQVVFFLLGNHEPYGTKFDTARASMEAFQQRMTRAHMRSSKLGKFVYLHRTRYDISDDLIVLGCTLFSQITSEQEGSVHRFISDFSEIEDWTVADHCAAHESDLRWLDDQVETIAQQEPSSSIIVFTHYSPTKLQGANDPKHLDDAAEVNSAFVTDISNHICWTMPQVKLWAFGHTHFNCDIQDPRTGKRIFTNQKGNRRKELITFDGAKVVRAP